MRQSFILLAIIWLAPFAKVAAVETLRDWEADLRNENKSRIHKLILALDAPAVTRDAQVEKLANAAKGENADMVMEMLHKGLSYDNPQVREGIIDVLARVGSSRSVPVLARHLRYEKFIDIRIRILRLLPVFLLGETPALQNEVRLMAERENYSMTGRLRHALRRGPIRISTGEYSPALEHLRKSIMHAVGGQLDVIGTAISGVDSKQDDVRARLALVYFCGRELGRSREEWQDKWGVMGLNFHSPKEMELTTIETMACRILADIGAYGSFTVIKLLGRLTRVKREASNEAALITIAELTRIARSELKAHRKRLAGRQDLRRMSEAEQTWRKHQVDCAIRMIDLAWKSGRDSLAAESPAIRRSAYVCIGASRNPTAVELLQRRMIRAGEPPDVQVAISMALGEIGGEQAVKVLNMMLGHWTGQDAGKPGAGRYRLIQSVIAALGGIAGRYDPQSRSVRVADGFAGKLAVGSLLSLLGSRDSVPGAPRNPDGSPMRLEDLVLRRLQLITGLRDSSGDPAIWRQRYAQLLLHGRVVKPE